MISFCGLYRNHRYHFYTTGYMPELETAHKRSLRLGDAEPISGFDKAQVSCKFYLGLHYKSSSQLQILPGPTLQKLESAANSTWAYTTKARVSCKFYLGLHYKSSSQLQILPGPTLQKLESAANSTRAYTTKWQWACLGLQQSSSQLQILPGSYTTKVAVGPSQLQILPGPFTRKATTAMFRRCCAQAGKVAR